jgi:dsRNA-specific ribonuclease
MRIEVKESETSTSKRPLWVWRVWCNGRLTQGFGRSEEDAKQQAELSQYPGHSGLGRRL